MGRLAKNIYQYLPEAKYGRKLVGDKLYDSVHPLGASVVHTYDAKIEADNQLKQATADAATGKDVIPMPNEDDIARARRRRDARMRGGRDSTVLSQDEGLGG